MTVLTQGPFTGEFILTEASGSRSRDTGVVSSGSGKLESGAVLALVAGEYAPAAAATTAVAILLSPVDATSAAAPCVVVNADAEVKRDALIFAADVDTPAEVDAKLAQLRAVGIKAR